MKIDANTNKLGPLGSGLKPASERSTPAAGGSPPAVAESKTTAAVQSLGLTASNASFDQKRVEAIRDAISAGSFEVNAEAVAEGLIDTVRDLIRNNPRSA